jgi:drug/metabolite transporter (DMT)-like permease
MLEHFDTVLSFAVVMLLLSLLVTTIVQMLLWYNMLRQLSNLRPAVAQKIEPKSVTGHSSG